jgi:hypothetical protein
MFVDCMAEILFLWYMAVIAEIHSFYVCGLHGRNTLFMIYCCHSRNTFFLRLLTVLADMLLEDTEKTAYLRELTGRQMLSHMVIQFTSWLAWNQTDICLWWWALIPWMDGNINIQLNCTITVVCQLIPVDMQFSLCLPFLTRNGTQRYSCF